MQIMKPTVFIVDDDEAMRDSLGLLMKSVGFDYETYSNGQDFLDKYEVGRGGCLLLDIRMPGMDGLAALRVGSIGHNGPPGGREVFEWMRAIWVTCSQGAAFRTFSLRLTGPGLSKIDLIFCPLLTYY